MADIGHNGGPAHDIDTDDIKMSWIKLDIADFKRGIADLDYETRGFYITILVEMYDSKGKLPNDFVLLGKRLGTTARVIRRVMDVLLMQGKVYVSGDFIRNRRCDEEREKIIAEYCRRHAAAVKREAEKRASTQKVLAKFGGSFPEVSPELSPNSGELQQSLAETFENSPTKSTNGAPELCQSREQNCAHNLEPRSKKKKEDTPIAPLQGDGCADPPGDDDARATRAATNREAAQIAFGEWQDLARRCGLTCPRDSSLQTFGRKMAARMFEHAAPPKALDDMLAVWRIALANVERSKFLRGMSEQKFRADLSFLCRKERFAKLIDGGYGNGAHAAPAKSEPGPDLDAIYAEMRAQEGWVDA